MQAPTNTYPIQGRANADVLYASMGSFWTQMFNEKATIKGLAVAQAEQMIQQYIELIEHINASSVKDTPVFNTVRNYPLQIRRSTFGTDMPLFGDGSVFGAQPQYTLYADTTFEFGQPKDAETNHWSYKLPEELKHGSVLANRAIQPSKVWVVGADVNIVDGRLYFRSNIFEDPLVTKFNVVDEEGNSVTFVDKDEIVQAEQIAVVWVLNAAVDQQALFYNHGYVFDMFQPSSQKYKDILVGFTKLFANGPSVHNIKSLCAAFLGVTPVIEAEETIVAVNSNDGQVTTDRHVYVFDKRYLVDDELILVGAKVHAGDILVHAVEYIDQLTHPNWWQTHMASWGFPPHLFVAGVKYELVFKNEIELVVRDADGYIHFPVEGHTDDVRRFNDHLNLNADEIGAALGLEPGEVIVLNPLEFIFEQFMKNNCALVSLRFKTLEEAQLFTDIFPIIRQCLPLHVYFIFLFDVGMASELYDWLAMKTPVTIYDEEVTRNADGTTATGFITSITNYKVDPRLQLFAFAKGVPTDLLQVSLNGEAGADLLVRDGELVGDLPESQSTKEVNNLLFRYFPVVGVTIPDVLRLDQTVARAALEAAGFLVEAGSPFYITPIITSYNATYNSGTNRTTVVLTVDDSYFFEVGDYGGVYPGGGIGELAGQQRFTAVTPTSLTYETEGDWAGSATDLSGVIYAVGTGGSDPKTPKYNTVCKITPAVGTRAARGSVVAIQVIND
ncbi:MAG: hypothetical protein EBU46_01830 [Nitrosomonadaceae bacterium]|nr:hypothetical protein [Nitrosomonadaceae bacterium]